MIIFLYGQDTYRSRQKLNEIIDHYKKTHQSGLNLKYFDFQKENYEDFREAIQSISMLAEKKLFILKNSFFNEDFKKHFLKDSKKFLDSKEIILFYEEKEIPEKEELFQFLKKSGKSQEFKLLESQRLKNWIKKELEKYNLKIDEKALEKLINFLDNDLWRISNEIKKLSTYKKNYTGPAPAISVKDVELLVKPKIETDIFQTIDAIAEKNKRKALSLIHQHLAKGDPPLYLLSRINSQFRNLLIVKSCESKNELYGNNMRILTKKLEVHPFVLRKTMQQVRRFTLEELKKIYQKIFQTDLAIKTGKIEPETALDMLVAEI